MYQCTTDLAQVALAQLLLEHDHEGGGQEDDEAVTNIAEHDSEQEREGDDRKQTGVDFLVSGNTIGIHDGLEALRKLVRADERRRRAVGAELVQDGRDIGTRFLLQESMSRWLRCNASGGNSR